MGEVIERAIVLLYVDDTSPDGNSARPLSRADYRRWSARVHEPPQPVDGVAVEGVEELLRHLLVGPFAAGEARRVLAPATGPPILERDVEVLLALGLDDQAGVVVEPHDEVGVVVAQGAGRGDVLEREAAVHRELRQRGDVARAIEEPREPPLERVVDRRQVEDGALGRRRSRATTGTAGCPRPAARSPRSSARAR